MTMMMIVARQIVVLHYEMTMMMIEAFVSDEGWIKGPRKKGIKQIWVLITIIKDGTATQVVQKETPLLQLHQSYDV